MTHSLRTLSLTVAAVAATTLGASAAGRGNSERVRERVSLNETGAVEFDRSAVIIQRQNLRNQSILLRTTGAPADALFVFLADELGALQQVGALRHRGASGLATWDVRTARGDPLPFGVPDVADLSGRVIEVRGAGGAVLLTGAMPQTAKATGIARRMKSLRTGFAVNDAVAGSDVTAELEFERHRDGESLTIELEDAAPGLTLEAWIRGTDGTFVKLGDLVQDADEDDDSADEDQDTDDATVDDTDVDDADDDVPDGDSEYSLVLDATSGLPFGATSFADLAGLAIEIRNAADGAVVAGGFMPDVSAPDDVDDDDQGEDEQGDDTDGQ